MFPAGLAKAFLELLKVHLGIDLAAQALALLFLSIDVMTCLLCNVRNFLIICVFGSLAFVM